MPELERRYAVLDTETGEVINTIGEGDSVYRKESRDAIAGKIINFNKGESFVKTYDDGMKRVRGKLTNAQCSFLWYLLPQMEFNTNILRNDDGTLLENKHLEKITNMKYDTNRKLMLSLVKDGIIGQWRVGSADKKDLEFECFVVNPYIFHKGTMIYEGLLELFGKTGWNTED